MTPGFSVWLNLLRAGAALLVLASHWAYPRFTEGRWIALRDYNLGSDAVVLFFVLSGFVIAYAAREKDRDLRGFALARATRLWSVALPALLLTFALDRIGVAFWPEAYAGWWYAPQDLGAMLLRGLSFTNEWWGMQARLGSNGPWWSLSYEVAYYALFAIAFYLRGARRAVLLALGALAVGPVVLALMPCWLVGVWLYARLRLGALPARGWALVWAILPMLAYLAAQAAGLPAALLGLTEAALGPNMPLILRFSDEVLWNSLLALGVGLHLWGMAGLLAQRRLARIAPPVTWLAGGSFSIYVVHYPVLQALDAGLALPGGVARDAALFGLTLAACLVFAALFERPLPRFRRWLARLHAPKAASSLAT